MPSKSKKQRNVREDSTSTHSGKTCDQAHPETSHDEWEKNQQVDEASKRDYKDEYKKFQSSPKSKKYRAELNKYNRKKGTYGNGDKKDASHKGGKIVGFEEQSKNRGRKEKSRLKKEQKLGKMIIEKLLNSQGEQTDFKKGDICEVYSRTKEIWMKGRITMIKNNKLFVKYGNNRKTIDLDLDLPRHIKRTVFDN